MVLLLLFEYLELQLQVCTTVLRCAHGFWSVGWMRHLCFPLFVSLLGFITAIRCELVSMGVEVLARVGAGKKANAETM